MNAEKSPENHNVDHEEIAKFEAVASRWWDLEGEFKPLHRINPLCSMRRLSLAIITSFPRTTAPIIVPGGSLISSMTLPTTREVLSSP